MKTGVGRLRHTYQGSGTKFYQQESSDNLSVDYGPACRTEVAELLEAGQAADEAAGAPGATEEAEDGEEPTLGLYRILHPGQDLIKVLRDDSPTVWMCEPNLLATSSTRHLHPLTPEILS